MFHFVLLFQFSHSDQPGPDNSTISPLDQCVFIFPAPLPPNATPSLDPYWVSENQITLSLLPWEACQGKVDLQLHNGTPYPLIFTTLFLSFSCSFFLSLSVSFLAGWRSQSKCNERGRGKRWRQKIIWVLSDESKRNPHGWAGNRHGLAATSTASLYLPKLQPFISLRRKLSAHYTSSHPGGGGHPVRRAPNGCGSSPDWGSPRTFIIKL